MNILYVLSNLINFVVKIILNLFPNVKLNHLPVSLPVTLSNLIIYQKPHACFICSQFLVRKCCCPTLLLLLSPTLNFGLETLAFDKVRGSLQGL